MMKNLLLALVAVSLFACQAPPSPEVAAWEARAENVEIVRDDWGVPHIYADTDANAVFGLMYAMAEDDFHRIEVNFLNSQGRLAEAMGEEEIWRDLRMKLFIDPAEMQALYADSPAWLQDLMDAWADGLNYYLHTHPETEPMVLDRFEPWMALTFSEGSIGGDIERVSLRELEDFYENPDNRISAVIPGERWDARGEGSQIAMAGVGAPSAWPTSSLVEPDPTEEPRGSNGISIAPELSASGNALLLINPHTSFFFRHEAHVVSDEGLNAYGALTWGQFFIYQGFNETAGWMHTSSGVDNIDEFVETVVERDGDLFYLYGDEERPVETRQVTVPYRTDDGGMAEREFTVYRTHHGPIVRAVDGRWVSVALMEEPRDALIQSYIRTKASNMEEYIEAMRAHTNSSNNTLFADAEGNIAYFHSNFIPVRNPAFDYTEPVDGSNPETDWNGVHSVEETPNSINPANGWAFNTNNWPWSASGEYSPQMDDYPVYVERDREENDRGHHALMLLVGADDVTLEGLRAMAYDSYLPYFERELPGLLAAYDALPTSDARRQALAGPIEQLRGWDYRWGVESVPTAVAIFWATERREADGPVAALVNAVERLEEEFGSWETPWGEINRFQRLTGDIVQDFDDDAPSTPVGFTSGSWGSLASFGARPYDGTVRWYGTSGNSFVAVVEFGERLEAVAVTAGGLHNDPASPHFNDQADRYATGDLRPVRFYREDVEANAEQTYRPGG